MGKIELYKETGFNEKAFQRFNDGNRHEMDKGS